jgi:hypothetical protein
MDRKQEAVETTENTEPELTDDASVNQAISFLEKRVEQNIGSASDGRL